MPFHLRCHTRNTWLVLGLGGVFILAAVILIGWHLWARNSQETWKIAVFCALAYTLGICYLCVIYLTRPPKHASPPPNPS
jgi:uncharacterized oligopeptide transporter (OPT) family protein